MSPDGWPLLREPCNYLWAVQTPPGLVLCSQRGQIRVRWVPRPSSKELEQTAVTVFWWHRHFVPLDSGTLCSAYFGQNPGGKRVEGGGDGAGTQPFWISTKEEKIHLKGWPNFILRREVGGTAWKLESNSRHHQVTQKGLTAKSQN